MHAGRMTTDAFAAWAAGEGATPDSARALGRLLVGRFAGRTCDAVVGRKLLAKAEQVFGFDIPGAGPAPASDGTVRYAVRLSDGQIVEAVAIAHASRTTVCLSTQAGCARGCSAGRRRLARRCRFCSSSSCCCCRPEAEAGCVFRG